MMWIERLRPHPSADAVSRLKQGDIIHTGPQKFSRSDEAADSGSHDGNPWSADAPREPPDSPFKLTPLQERSIVVQ